MEKRTLSPRPWAGFSLVELLVATAITLIGLLVITQVFAVYEGWKRTTTGVAQTQEGGLLGAFAIEQDLRSAGFGMIGVECPNIVAYNANAAPSKRIDLSGSSVTISSDSPAKGSDRIGILYSSSPFANVAAKIQNAAATAADDLYVDNGLGFAIGDMILISAGASCAILQVSDKPADKQMANVTAPGSSWKLPHDAVGSAKVADAALWNPPAGDDIFPPGGYPVGTRVLNLGQLLDHSFYVEGKTLRMDERSMHDGSVSAYDLIPGVEGLRAQCLPVTSPCSDQSTAVRFGLIVRSGNRERDVVSQQEVSISGGKASIAFWPGADAPTFDLGSEEEALHYRYRVFQTVVPLKNIIWNP